MKPASAHACDAWQLLTQLFFAHRANLPTLAAELQLSPAQCHVLHLIEPGRPIPMGQLAETLACDASNVTGLVDRLESRGSRSPARVRGGPAGQGPGADADRGAAPHASARSHDRTARHPPAALRRRAAVTRANPCPAARVTAHNCRADPQAARHTHRSRSDLPSPSQSLYLTFLLAAFSLDGYFLESTQ